MATLDGENVFGVAVKIAHTPRANAHQMAEFFGVNGVLSSFGGARGRMFMVEGLFAGETAAACVAAEAAMRALADGAAHTLVDTFDRVWAPVIFRGEIQNAERGPMPGSDGNWYWPYKLVLEGLT
jgi:hypothetical protein